MTPIEVTFPFACFVGLTVAGAEVPVAGYTRQPVTLAVSVDGATIANLAAVAWTAARAVWGVVDGVTLWDAASGGTMLSVAPAVPPVTIGQYDSARIPPAGLALTYTAVVRGFGTMGFGTWGFGTGGNLLNGIAVLIERGFDNQQHVCAPGTWAPGPFSVAA